jgi:hypothetical protein
LIQSKTAKAFLAIGFWMCAHTQAVFAQSEITSPPGEQVSGDMVVPDQGVTSDTSVRLLPEEIQVLRLDHATTSTATTPEHGLPPIVVRITRGYYDRVAYTVTRLPDEYRHRRHSLASRGAHPMLPKAISQTVYRSVYRRTSQPMDISPIIMKYAEKYQLDPWLLRGIIEVESAFHPNATSCVGAGGLMQLMPGTARHLGCGDRYDPEQNIAAGARYIRQMYDKFGDYNLAIAAYNAGPGNVEKHGGIPPFAETQNYVRKVVRAWQAGPSRT